MTTTNAFPDLRNATSSEKLGFLYAMMAGIPAERIDLDRFLQWKPRPSDCRTIACTGGWAAMHPSFKALGLTHHSHGPCSLRCGTFGDFVALAHVFGIKRSVACALFDSTRLNEYKLSDKAAALKRIRTHLLLSGAITAERNKELIAYEAEVC